MPKITKLERQKHNDTRVSVFVDDEYAFSVQDELIIEYGITQGLDIKNLPLNRIKEEDSYKTCLSVAFKHMSVSEKSEKQMRDFLTKKEFAQSTIDRVILRLKELNYIDDLSFAKSFIEHSKKTGRRALEYKLKLKGISQKIIDEALENETDSIQEEKAFLLAQKQLPKYLKYELYEQKRRVNAYLVQHGFGWEIASNVIEKLFSKED